MPKEIDVSCVSCNHRAEPSSVLLCRTCDEQPQRIFPVGPIFTKIKFGSPHFAYRNWEGPGFEIEEFLEKELFEI